MGVMGVAGFSVTFVVYIRIYLTVRRHNSPIQYMQIQDNARIRSNVSEASCLRTQRHAPARTWTRAVRPRFQNTDHWTTHASQSHAPILFYQVFLLSSICIALIETLAWLSLWKKISFLLFEFHYLLLEIEAFDTLSWTHSGTCHGSR